MVRWSERTADGKRIQRGFTLVGSAADAEQVAIEAYRALSQFGAWEPPTSRVPTRPTVADISQMLQAYYRYGEQRGLRPPTLRTLARRLNVWLAHARTLHGREELPVTLLSPPFLRDVFSSMECSESWRYLVATAVVPAWLLAWDERQQYPGLPEPPRNTSALLPRAPPKPLGKPAPTWAEVDAVLKRMRGPTLPLVLIMRGTGLRPATVANIQRSDLDLEAGTLRVRHDKREAAQGRVVPLVGWLVDRLRNENLENAGTLVGGDPGAIAAQIQQRLGKAIQGALDAGELRADVVGTEGRGRRSALFRSAFQAGLRRADVPERVIDCLVGHHAKSIRDLHYDPATQEAMAQAVRHVAAPRGSRVVPSRTRTPAANVTTRGTPAAGRPGPGATDAGDPA